MRSALIGRVSASKRIELLVVEPADDPAVEHGGRRDRAQPEAINRLQRHAPSAVVSPNAMPSRASARAASASPPAAWQASARHSFSTCRPGGLAAEVVIKGDDAMHFGARDIQRFRDHRLGGLVDVAECLLQGVQDRQQRALQGPDARR